MCLNNFELLNKFLLPYQLNFPLLWDSLVKRSESEYFIDKVVNLNSVVVHKLVNIKPRLS